VLAVLQSAQNQEVVVLVVCYKQLSILQQAPRLLMLVLVVLLMEILVVVLQ
jgi:hypothetical protein